jgi:hypothetical protein
VHRCYRVVDPPLNLRQGESASSGNQRRPEDGSKIRCFQMTMRRPHHYMCTMQIAARYANLRVTIAFIPTCAELCRLTGVALYNIWTLVPQISMILSWKFLERWTCNVNVASHSTWAYDSSQTVRPASVGNWHANMRCTVSITGAPRQRSANDGDTLFFTSTV